MTTPGRQNVFDYKMSSKRERYIDSATDIFSGKISDVISHLQVILDQGYTHMETGKWVDYDYSHEFAVCETNYYRLREETDEEYQKRCEDERLKKEAKQIVFEALTPEQRKVLGL